MTNEIPWHPDLLRRFVATPFVFVEEVKAGRLCIQSNELDIALEVRRFCLGQRSKNIPRVQVWKLLRDTTGKDRDSQISTVTDDSLRTLYFGTGTVLVHDRQQEEVLGFVSAKVSSRELVSSLLPLLLNMDVSC